jgi:xanthine/uracil permease
LVCGLPPAPDFTPAAGSFFIPAFDFQPGAILAFIFCFIAVSVNQLGSSESIGFMLKAPALPRRNQRGQILAGLLNVGAGALGVIGPVSYSLSAGIIGAGGCASRFTLIPAGLGLIICGFFPQLVLLFANIPKPVLGGMMLYLMGSQLASGLIMLVKENCIADFRGGMSVGLALMVGLLTAFAPAAMTADLPPFLRPLAGNSFILGISAALIMEHLILRGR